MTPTAECSIEIAAPIEVAWGVMMDLARYGEWNPFIVAVDHPSGEVGVGSRLKLHVKWLDGGGVSSGELITRIETPASTRGATAALEYDFTGPLAALGLVTATRVQSLTALTPTSVRYDSREVFRGLLCRFIPLRKVQAGFTAHANALKARAESLARSGSTQAAQGALT